LTVTTYPVDGTTPTRRSGPVLSVLRKQNGRWAIYRDANMIT
jgi:ketosteroid isomerase-like protein